MAQTSSNSTETAIFGGGCFWCTEAIFQKLRGVQSVVSGYAGGEMQHPSYQEVSMGRTGHAEAVQITFNPAEISYQTLLDVFWNTHNPTTLNQQGADIGSQYRSVIFYQNEDQKRIAEESRQAFDKSGAYSDPVVTQIIPLTEFYPAEDYHQNYFQSQPTAPYCQIVIRPKLQKLVQKYQKLIENK